MKPKRNKESKFRFCVVIFVSGACSFLDALFVPLGFWNRVFSEAHIVHTVVRGSIMARELYSWAFSYVVATRSCYTCRDLVAKGLLLGVWAAVPTLPL